MTPDVTIRPIDGSDADYVHCAALEAAVWPDSFESAEEIKYDDSARTQDVFSERYLAWQGAELVGSGLCAQAHWLDDAVQYRIDMLVMPNRQGDGIGKAIYRHLVDVALAQGAQRLLVFTREDKPRSVRFLADRGFVQKERTAVSHLDMTVFDAAPFASKAARVATSGINIYSYAELDALDPAWRHKLWELRWPIRQDMPGSQVRKRQPFDEFERYWLDAPNVDWDGCFVAIDGTPPDGKFVGLTTFWTAEADKEKLYTGTTGVLRAYRRRGIALALKLRGLAFAQQRGVKLIETDNDEANPMLNLNVALGFRPHLAWLMFTKELDS